jgi:hypothetical protein
MQMAGNAKSQSEMNKTRAAFVAKNAKLQDESDQIALESAGKSSPKNAQKELDAGAAGRENAWNNLQLATTPIASALPATSSPDSATGRATAATGGATSAWNRIVTNAGARMGSYGDWETQQAVKNADAAQRLGIVNNFARGNANLLPLEMTVASQKGDKLSGWGQLVGALGAMTSVGGMAAGAFASAPGAATVAGVKSSIAGGLVSPESVMMNNAAMGATAIPAADTSSWLTAFGGTA